MTSLAAKTNPIILGIESSCDETAAAIIKGDRSILSNIIASSSDIHAAYGGVVPEIAARAHLDTLAPVITSAMQEANLSWDEIDGIAATGGPGLIGGVLVGTVAAKAIAQFHDKPYFAINHLEGHALTARLTDDVSFPYLLLLVSGGHTQISMSKASVIMCALAQQWMMQLANYLTKLPKFWALAIQVDLPLNKLPSQETQRLSNCLSFTRC